MPPDSDDRPQTPAYCQALPTNTPCPPPHHELERGQREGRQKPGFPTTENETETARQSGAERRRHFPPSPAGACLPQHCTPLAPHTLMLGWIPGCMGSLLPFPRPGICFRRLQCWTEQDYKRCPACLSFSEMNYPLGGRPILLQGLGRGKAWFQGKQELSADGPPPPGLPRAPVCVQRL